MPALGGYHDVKRIFEENQVHPIIRFELMEENAIMSMVAHHLGISILVGAKKRIPIQFEGEIKEIIKLAESITPNQKEAMHS